MKTIQKCALMALLANMLYRFGSQIHQMFLVTIDWDGSAAAVTKGYGLLSENKAKLTLLPEQAFSACLLVKDDNPILLEWLAYHYTVLPLPVDPDSQTSPAEIVERWNNAAGLGMNITQWTDQDFLPEKPNHKELLKKNEYQEKKDMHRFRQRHFFHKCMLNLKRRGSTWVSLFDTDEYLTFNHDWPPEYAPHAEPNATKLLPRLGESTALDFLQQEMHRNATFVTQSPCLPVPRIFYSSVESPLPSDSKDDNNNPDIPAAGFNVTQFETIRFVQHAKVGNRFNGLKKNLVDVSRVEEQYINGTTSLPPNVHRPIVQYCTRQNYFYGQYPIFRLNHYLGSWERYNSRVDARDGHEKSEKAYKERALVAEQTTDDLRPWLKLFVDRVGDERARHLLEGVGVIPPKQNS
ncbi:MAG: hypothetical protein SGARI_005025 [Bacillariaceae sp.]